MDLNGTGEGTVEERIARRKKNQNHVLRYSQESVESRFQRKVCWRLDVARHIVVKKKKKKGGQQGETALIEI